MLYEFGGFTLDEHVTSRCGSAAPNGGLALGSLGAFLVIEVARACRGARRQAASHELLGGACPTASSRKPGAYTAALKRLWDKISRG